MSDADDEDKNIDYDPYKHREPEAPLKNNEVCTKGIFSAMGAGVLAMPLAFSYTGLALGPVLTTGIYLMYMYCMYILVNGSLRLCRRMRVPQLAYDEVIENAVLQAPERYHKMAAYMKFLTGFFLVLGLLGCCAVQYIFFAKHLKQLVESNNEGVEIDMRFYILMIVPWFMVLTAKGDTKSITSYIGSTGLITIVPIIIIIIKLSFFGVVKEGHGELLLISSQLQSYPLYLGIMCFTLLEGVVVSLEGIFWRQTKYYIRFEAGMVLLIENNAKKPDIYVNKPYYLFINCIIVNIILCLSGVLGYWFYGNSVQTSPILVGVNSIYYQIVYAVSFILMSFRINVLFHVMFSIMWRNKQRSVIAECYMRCIFGILAALIALVVPNIAAVMGFFGALCLSFVGFIVPAWVDIFVCWQDPGWGPCWWRFWLDLLITGFGLFIWIIGTVFNSKNMYDSFSLVYNKYTDPKN